VARGYRTAEAGLDARARLCATGCDLAGNLRGDIARGLRHNREEGLSSFHLGALPAATGVSSLRKNYQNPLWVLLALSELVLLIACANLANLMLARASARQREMTLRLALCASRSRLIRQLLAEGLLLAALGTLAGVGLAQILSRALVAFLSPQQNPIFVDLTPDWRVFGFAAGLAILTCILFGLAHAIQASQTEPGVAIKASARGTTAARSYFLLRRAFVVSQVALSLCC
jgi:predicted lysophospholipase L1 biosynthesis ABC-type transport system permease subunit